MRRIIKSKVIVGGGAKGELVVLRHPISLLGELDPHRGLVISGSEKLDVKRKILFLPYVRGSTVGSYVLYAAKANGVAPAGLIALRPDPILITGAVISEIPLYQPLEPISPEEAASFSCAVLSPETSSIALFDECP